MLDFTFHGINKSKIKYILNWKPHTGLYISSSLTSNNPARKFFLLT